MTEQEDRLIFGKEIQSLWGAAFHAQIERSRPWTRDEVHNYLKAKKGIDSMKKVLKSDYDELLGMFSGDPVIVERPPITDDEIPF